MPLVPLGARLSLGADQGSGQEEWEYLWASASVGMPKLIAPAMTGKDTHINPDAQGKSAPGI